VGTVRSTSIQDLAREIGHPRRIRTRSLLEVGVRSVAAPRCYPAAEPGSRDRFQWLSRGNESIQAVLGCSHKEATLKQRSAISTRGILDIVDHQHGRARMGAGVGRSAASGSSRARSDCGISCTWAHCHCVAHLRRVWRPQASSRSHLGRLPTPGPRRAIVSSCRRATRHKRSHSSRRPIRVRFGWKWWTRHAPLRQLIGCGKL
jgi:hypothetical protein